MREADMLLTERRLARLEQNVRDLLTREIWDLAWVKITANSLTLTTGSSASALADLQTARDGNFYHIDEAAGAPGIDLVVDFVDVEVLVWVNILAWYDGSTTHALAVQLYNWTTAAWDTFDAIQTGAGDVTTAGGYILGDHSCWVPASIMADYIGTGGNLGQVRVRLYHTMMGNAAHDLEIDVVALYY